MKPTALIVDDHPVNRLVLQAALEGVADVRHAEDGLEGLEEIHAHRPDVVFLDLMMPRMDGFGVIDALEQENNPILSRVIVVTARSDENTRRALLAQGVRAFVPKPVVIREVVDLFKELTQGGAARDETRDDASGGPSRAAAPDAAGGQA